MVLHAIACAICRSKCDEHSGRVCSSCRDAIVQGKRKLFKTEPEKFQEAYSQSDRKKVESY
jgi:hypothetical protein